MRNSPAPLPASAFLIACGLLASASLDAQVRVVVPASAANSDARARMMTHFAEGRTRRVQLLLDAEHLKGLAGRRIYELAFRKDLKYLGIYDHLRGGEKTSMRILASWSDAQARAPGIEFRSNFGSQVVEVFRGEVPLPKVSTKDTRAVSSFAPSEAPTIRFQSPLMHQAGKTLVLDFQTFLGNASGYHWEWPLDAETRPKRGTVRVIGKACWPSRHAAAADVMLATLRPGMHIKTKSVTPPSPHVAFLVFGFSDKTAFGALPLPAKIADPSCMLYVSPDVVLQTTFFTGVDPQDEGFTAQTVPTPQLSGLYGATLYYQYVFLHQAGSGFALATSNGVAATFTKQPPSLGMSVVANLDSSARTGRVFLDFGPVMRLSAK